MHQTLRNFAAEISRTNGSILAGSVPVQILRQPAAQVSIAVGLTQALFLGLGPGGRTLGVLLHHGRAGAVGISWWPLP